MTAIETKFIAPTNHRPARIKAFTRTKPSRSITISYHNYINPHETAANTLIDKLNWRDNGAWVEGHTDTGAIYVCCPTILKA